ncbi:Flp pilus assembly complex ATPase component TadA [bacterium]|nr:Flp pilus assembly complex ATPase component TadA [bacterium]
MTGQDNLIGKYLLEKGIINQTQLQEVVEESQRTNRRVGDILVRRDLATEEDIIQTLSEQLGFAFLDLSSYQIEPEALALIPAQAAERLQVIPIFKVADSLSVAMVNPLDISAIDELYRLTNLRIRPLFATPTGIKSMIEKHYGRKEVEVKEGIASSEARPSLPEGEVSRLLQEATQPSVIKLVDQLISDAVASEASDIHLEPQEDSFYCRFRIDGILHEVPPPPRELRLAIVSRVKIMANMDIAQSRLPQDGRIQTKVRNRKIDLRVATFPTIYGEHISIRILDKTKGILGLEELGFAPDILKKFKEIIHKPYGIILVVGPTGCGKTTTLYAILNIISDLKKNILTLEDPVEYTIPRIHQTQINVKAGLTFTTGLRSMVRLDPDIIMIGEIRDKETANIAIHSALTGHLVFSTLHTNDTPSAITRLIDIGVEPYLVASSLTGVLAQRLVRRLCPKCKKEYQPTEETLSVVTPQPSTRRGVRFYKESGCRDCHNTGYKGRIGIFELLIPDNGLRELILKKTPTHQLRAASQKAGMKTLAEDGFQKVIQGITSPSEILRVTEEA